MVPLRMGARARAGRAGRTTPPGNVLTSLYVELGVSRGPTSGWGREVMKCGGTLQLEVDFKGSDITCTRPRRAATEIEKGRLDSARARGHT